MSTIINAKSCERNRHELTEAELANVSGGGNPGAGAGKVTFNPFSITRHIDKASPVLL